MQSLQWSNLTKCGKLVFNVQYPLWPTHFWTSVLQHFDSRGIEALILILEKVLNCRYDLIISPILLPSQVGVFYVGEHEIVRWCQIRRENMEGDQPVQSHSHEQQPLQPQICVQEHCPGETGSPPFVSFPGCSQNVSNTTFQVLNYFISSVSLSGRKNCS